jgi:hypothetical protein
MGTMQEAQIQSFTPNFTRPHQLSCGAFSTRGAGLSAATGTKLHKTILLEYSKIEYFSSIIK